MEDFSAIGAYYSTVLLWTCCQTSTQATCVRRIIGPISRSVMVLNRTQFPQLCIWRKKRSISRETKTQQNTAWEPCRNSRALQATGVQGQKWISLFGRDKRGLR